MRFEYIVPVACCMGYMWSLCGFCERFSDHLKIDKKIFAVLLFCMGMLVNLFLVPTNLPYICQIMLCHFLFLGVFFLVVSDEACKKLFVGMVLITAKVLVWNFGGSFFACAALIITNMATHGQMTGLDPKTDCMVDAAAYCLAIFSLRFLKKRLASVFEHKIKGWYLMLSALLFLIVVIVEVVNWGATRGIMVVSNVNGPAYWDIYYNQIFSHSAICLLTLLSMCIALGAIFGMNRIYMEQRQKEQYHAQIEYYKMLNEQYLQMERLRHDMKNHVLSLRGLWENREFEAMGSYLEKMLVSGSFHAGDEVTGNPAIDALLHNRKLQAGQQGIRWKCDVRIPKDCGIDTFDLCVLFGNILDNAYHGCMEVRDGERRSIRIQAGPVKKCFLLVALNGTVLQNSEKIRPGIGMLNIVETVKKYNGTIDAKAKDQVFEVSILLPMNGDGYDRNETT